MNRFIASALKYRPQNFDDVIGQKNITNTLENALEKNQIPHAMLFCGPHGVGKTTCARILAWRINQKDDKDSHKQQEDIFNVFELDAASNNSVDDIRSLNEQIRYAPQGGKYKVYIIDEVHMLSKSAFNAFLKTLEEPPKHVIFILATTEKHKVLPTILSRCQIFDFKRINTVEIKNFLVILSKKESIHIPNDALHLIASKAQGSLRDALYTFDQVVSFSGKKISLEDVTEMLNILDYETYLNMSRTLLEGKIIEALLLFDTILNRGFQANLFASGLGSHFRDLLVSKDAEANKFLDLPEEVKENYAKQSKYWEISELIHAIEICEYARVQYVSSVNGRLSIELALMQLASIKKTKDSKKNPKFYIKPETEVEVKSDSIDPLKTKTQENKKDSPSNVEQKTEVEVKSDSIDPLKTKTQENKKDSPSNVEQKTEVEVKSDSIDPLKTKTQENKKDSPSNVEQKTEVEVKSDSIDPLKTKTQENKKDSPSNVEQKLVEKKAMSLGFSIQTLLSEEETYQAESNRVGEEPKDTFSEQELKRKWNLFAEKQKDKGNINVYRALAYSKPKLVSENKIYYEFASLTMERSIENEKETLTQFLKKELNNYSIEIETYVNESKKEVLPYTPKDKYNYFVKKNSLVKTLKENLNLDYDY